MRRKWIGQLESGYFTSTVKLYFLIWKEIELTWVQNRNFYSDNSYLNENVMNEMSMESVDAT